jgi:hypothetical protein
VEETAVALEETTTADSAEVENDGAHDDSPKEPVFPDEPAVAVAAEVSAGDLAPVEEAASSDEDASGSEPIEASSEPEVSPEALISAEEAVSSDGDASDSEPLPTSSEAESSPSDSPQEIDTGREVAVEPQPEAPPPATVDETVTVWRFARPPAPTHHPRPPRPPRRRFPAPGEPRVQTQGTVEAPAALPLNVEIPLQDSGLKEPRAAQAQKPFHGGKRKTWDTTKTKTWDTPKPQRGPDKREPLEAREATGGRSGGDRKPAIDPMSPFAKLMELRSILESEGKGKKRN